MRGNDISDNRTAISFSGTTRLPLLSENRICANDVNVRIVGSASTWTARAACRSRPDGMMWVTSASPSRDPGRPPGTEIIGFEDGRIHYQEGVPSLTIERSDGTSVKHDFRGPLSGIAVSPAGIVVIENVRRRHVIEDVLGAGAAAGDWRFVNEDEVDDPDRPDWGDQVAWWLESPEGEFVELRLADHGYGAVGRDDSHVATLGWHSADGLTWTPIRGATLSWDDDILGTEQGFWWRHGNDAATSLWFSPDGLSWTRLSRVTSWRMLPWADGVVMMDGTDIVAATPTGARVLGGPSASFGEARWLEAGPLGLLLLDDARGLLAFSTDGATWDIGDVPASWAEPGAGAGAVALGEGAVIVRIDRCSDPMMYRRSCFDGLDGASMASELWRGTISP